ncbi:MAG TPA: methylmalonyl-CoA epimerase [Methylomirabilota bacterium]
MRRIHHVGLVVRSIANAYKFYRDTLGLPLIKEKELRGQGVRAALLAAGDSELELLEPRHEDNGVARFLARRGEGLHHVCFETEDVAAALAALKRKGVELIDEVPRPGLAGRIAFLHPRACAGVLVELATPLSEEPVPRAPVRLKRLVVGAREPKHTVAAFQSLFGFPEVAMNGGPRTMLGVGRGALLVVPSQEVGGTEGMVALSLLAEDFPALTAAFDRAKTRQLRGTGEITVEPESSHGVHLHISRYE